MFKKMLLIMTFIVVPLCGNADNMFETDVIKTSAGDLKIIFIGHGSLAFEFDGKNIYIDPWTKLADYSSMPKADIILVTHGHSDHLDPEAVRILSSEKTEIIAPEACSNALKNSMVMRNSETKAVQGISIEAVPAYNLIHRRENGEPFHPRGEGNGYVLSFGGTKVYVAGDTENIPEMKLLENIAVAFLPVNLPYTMEPEMAAEAVLSFRPAVFYPYHYGETRIDSVAELLKEAGIEVRIRRMQ